MIKLSWKTLNTRDFISGVVKLAQNDNLETKTAYRVARIFQAAGKEMEKARALENEIKAKYTLPGTDQFVDGGEAKMTAEFAEMMEKTEAEIKVHKLDFHQLQGLSALQLTALEPIIDGLPTEEEA